MRKYLMGLILSKAASRVGRYAGRKVRRGHRPARTGGMRKLLLGAGIAAAAAWLIGKSNR
jgi:hypothetical protein